MVSCGGIITKLNKNKMNLEQEFEKETGFEVYDKTNVKYNGAYVEWLESRIEQLTIGGVSSMLPSINSITFKNYLEAKGYAETLNPLVYKKQGFEYDKEILHRHFLNEIEFGN